MSDYPSDTSPRSGATAAGLVRELYATGKREYQSKSFEAAEKTFLELLELEPNNSGAWYYVGRSRYERNDVAGAISALRMSVKYTTTNTNPVTWLAKVYRRAGLTAQAAVDPPGEVEPAAAAAPAKAEAQAKAEPPAPSPPQHEPGSPFALGELHYEAGDYESAVKSFWIAGGKGDVEALRSYVQALSRLVTQDRAAAKRWINETSKSVDQGALATRIESAGHASDAATLHQALFFLNGKADNCRAAVRLLEQAGQPGSALDFLDEVLVKHPDKKWAYQLHVDLCLNHHRLEDGLRVSTSALQRFPQERSLLTRHARLLTSLGQWEEGARAWKALAAMEPGDPRSLIRAADSLRRGRKDLEAIEEYSAALKLDPHNRTALRGIARSLRRVGSQDRAIDMLRTLVELFPSDEAAWDDFVYALARAERLTEATAALDQAARALGSSEDKSAVLARIAEHAMFYDEALGFFSESIRRNPGNPEVQTALGRYYMRQGYLGKALDLFLNTPALQPVRKDLLPEVDRIYATQELLDLPIGSYETVIPEDVITWITRQRASLLSDDYVKGRVSILCTQLGSGGAERQAAITAAGLCTRVESVAMHCLSLDPAVRHDFYLPLIANHPIKQLTPSHKGLEQLLNHKSNKPFAEILRLLPEELAVAVAAWHIELRQQRPEVVHAWQDFGSVAGALAAMLAGVPRIVLATRNTRPENRYRRWKRYLAPAFRDFVKTQGVVLSNNSIAGARDYEDWLELPRDTIQVIYNGVDFTDLDQVLAVPDRPDIRQRLNIPADAVVVGGVFRLSGEKQPLMWLESARMVADRHANCHFVLCGGGTLRQEMETRVKEMGLTEKIHIVGVQSPIAVWYEIMDIFMLSSRNEGLPNVLLEAQYLGIPVVASDVGGVREVMVPGMSGWPVANVTAEKLAERINWVMENADWVRRAKVVARDHIRSNFGLEAMYANTFRLYGMDAALSADGKVATDRPRIRV